MCQQSTFLSEHVNIIFAFTSRLDQAAVPKFREVMAHGRLTVTAQFVADRTDVLFGVGQEQQNLKPCRV